MNIAIDVDNTLYPFDQECREAFFEMALEKDDREYLKGAYAPQVEWRSLGDVLGFEALLEAIEKVHDQTLSQVPYKGAVRVVQRIKEEGHTIKYVTTRNDKYWSDTYEWLMQTGFPGGEVFCSDQDKTQFISNCQYIIDDRPKTILDFIYDHEWKENQDTLCQLGMQDEPKVRKAFGLWFPYNQALTDVRNVLLAPTWRGLEYYLERKGIIGNVVAVP